MKRTQRMIGFLYELPPLLVLVGAALLFLAAGYGIGDLVNRIAGQHFELAGFAGFLGLLGFCAGAIFLMQREIKE